MTVWPYLMAISAVTVLITAVARDRAMLALSAMILAAYIGGRIIKAGLHPDAQLIAFAVLWISVAVADATQRQADTKSALLAAVALCYLWAKMASAPWAFGSVPFVVSDLAALAVMALIVKGSGRAFIGRVADLGYNLRRSGADNPCRVATQAQKAGQ
jgi:hypothetical protein